MTNSTLLVLNPLRATLSHYERELIATLETAGYQKIDILKTTQADGVVGMRERLGITLTSAFERARLGSSINGRAILVVWPMFGYLDPLSLYRLCKRNTVLFVLHDPTPLRHQYGHSRFSRRTFQWLVSSTRSEVVYHTRLAQEVGIKSCGVDGVVLAHPISDEPPALLPRKERHAVRVLGQYKQTRSLDALTAIASAARSLQLAELEIHGRGWPAVAGWKVMNSFVPEAKFDQLIESSRIVVIPYDSFFQSGVAVRCLERGIPVVAPRHEHIMQLYGSDWPGLVADANDWDKALLRAMIVDSARLRARAVEVRKTISQNWSSALSSLLGAEQMKY
ncbi:MAG: hypothetical protein PGN37_01620 [Mycobacterium kyogaense]|uniref:glycosyltransferase n=1 Tax=Mycobacterium kyogaense TaxID=2212479 RepID=UPI002FFB13E0